jgi:hypothetical protein
MDSRGNKQMFWKNDVASNEVSQQLKHHYEQIQNRLRGPSQAQALRKQSCSYVLLALSSVNLLEHCPSQAWLTGSSM